MPVNAIMQKFRNITDSQEPKREARYPEIADQPVLFLLRRRCEEIHQQHTEGINGEHIEVLFGHENIGKQKSQKQYPPPVCFLHAPSAKLLQHTVRSRHLIEHQHAHRVVHGIRGTIGIEIPDLGRQEHDGQKPAVLFQAAENQIKKPRRHQHTEQPHRMLKGKKPRDLSRKNIEQVKLRKARRSEHGIGRHLQISCVRNLPVGNVILHRIDRLRLIGVHQIRACESSGYYQNQRQQPRYIK